jgi:hypothetical protein
MRSTSRFGTNLLDRNSTTEVIKMLEKDAQTEEQCVEDYNFKNGLVDMKRDVILRLVNYMINNEIKTVFGTFISF